MDPEEKKEAMAQLESCLDVIDKATLKINTRDVHHGKNKAVRDRALKDITFAIQMFENNIERPENKLLNDIFWEFCKGPGFGAEEFLSWQYFERDMASLRQLVMDKIDVLKSE